MTDKVNMVRDFNFENETEDEGISARDPKDVVNFFIANHNRQMSVHARAGQNSLIPRVVIRRIQPTPEEEKDAVVKPK